jgi:signal peptidase I
MNELFALWNEHYWMDGWGLVWMSIDVATSWWIMVDARRRGRGWVRWMVFAWLLWLVAIAVWLFRRRRWPVSVALDRRTKLAFAGIALAVFVAGMAARMSFVYNFQVARVEGQAMASTLNDQDRLLVNKALYRDRDPAHGDIIMLRYPRDPTKSFVMRVIAAGGDLVWMENGAVFRNGSRLNEPYVDEANRGADDMTPLQIPPGSYFVMGDRRNNSSDSRHWGLVPRGHVVGKITRRWWPASSARQFE